MNPTPALPKLSAKCGHCGTETTMPILPCGPNRLCAECPACGWHKRLGHIAPQMELPINEPQ